MSEIAQDPTALQEEELDDADVEGYDMQEITLGRSAVATAASLAGAALALDNPLPRIP